MYISYEICLNNVTQCTIYFEKERTKLILSLINLNDTILHKSLSLKLGTKPYKCFMLLSIVLSCVFKCLLRTHNLCNKYQLGVSN